MSKVKQEDSCTSAHHTSLWNALPSHLLEDKQ